jgi:hypothetical protein
MKRHSAEEGAEERRARDQLMRISFLLTNSSMP